MPRKPRKSRVIKQSISPALRSYLETGTYDKDAEGACDVFLIELSPELKLAWDGVKDEIMSDFVEQNPGRRPWGWWKFDSKEPRLRMGGIGIPSHEVLAVAPCYEFGLPTSWIGEFEERHFENCKGKAIDWSDPPTFESQGTYLQRHGLLTDAEKKFLVKNPGLLEPEKITE